MMTIAKEELDNFRPTEQSFYRHYFGNGVCYSSGVKFLADRGDAGWLVDAIASYFGTAEMNAAIAKDNRLGQMQFWRLDVREDKSAILTARADEGVDPCITQEFRSTDFPLDHVRVWAARSPQGWRLFLPSEY